MAQHTILVISHDRLHEIRKDSLFGARLVDAIEKRRDQNTHTHPTNLHGSQLGQQFSSNDTLLALVENGVIKRLEVNELIYLTNALERFRKKQSKK